MVRAMDRDDQDTLDTMAGERNDADADRYRRRRLRLGALLFRLRYFMQDPTDIAANIYRHGPHTFAQLIGDEVRLVDGDRVETITLDAAIAWCKAALTTVE